MSGGISAAISLMVTASAVICVLAGRRQIGAADREQHLALEHEAVADDLDARPVRQHVTQLAEELAAIALQLLDLRRQRHVQLLAEIGDLRVLVAALRLRQIERLGDRGELRLQLVHLLVEQRDLRARRIAEPLLVRELRSRRGAALLLGHRARRRRPAPASPARRASAVSARFCSASLARSDSLASMVSLFACTVLSSSADLPLHLGEPRLRVGELLFVSASWRRARPAGRRRRGFLLRGVGAARATLRQSLLQLLARPRECAAAARHRPAAAPAGRAPPAACRDRRRHAPPAPAGRQAAASASRGRRWPPSVRG